VAWGPTSQGGLPACAPAGALTSRTSLRVVGPCHCHCHCLPRLPQGRPPGAPGTPGSPGAPRELPWGQRPRGRRRRCGAAAGVAPTAPLPSGRTPMRALASASSLDAATAVHRGPRRHPSLGFVPVNRPQGQGRGAHGGRVRCSPGGCRWGGYLSFRQLPAGLRGGFAGGAPAFAGEGGGSVGRSWGGRPLVYRGSPPPWHLGRGRGAYLGGRFPGGNRWHALGPRMMTMQAKWWRSQRGSDNGGGEGRGGGRRRWGRKRGRTMHIAPRSAHQGLPMQEVQGQPGQHRQH